MKRAIAVLLALTLSAMVAPAHAEDGYVIEGSLAEGAHVRIDLDGDGVMESVSWAMVPTEYDDSCLTLTVQPEGGAALTYPTDIIWQQAVYALDLDGDGMVELLLTGDVMSEDYCTACLRYDGSALYEVLFPDSSRGDSADGYFKQGYGLITAIDGDRLTLTGSQDVLGTWFGSRQVRLTPYDRFEFDDDGFWTREASDLNDADLWEYAALTTKIDLTCIAPDGSEMTLPSGKKLLVIASDKRETAHFITYEGMIGALDISPDYDNGWGWMVNGISESDCFEYVPYAD